MTTYKVLKGTNIQAVSSDPSNPIEGQVWYNTTDNVTKGRGATTAGSWSSGGNLNTGRRAFGGAGTQTTGLSFGGGPSGSHSTDSREYDGTSWTAGNSMNNSKALHCGCGTQTAALASHGTPHPNTTSEEYNGTSWTAGGTIGTARYNVGGGGSSSSAVAFGGYYSSNYRDHSEDYDGTSWTAGNSLNGARGVYNGGDGTSADYVYAVSGDGAASGGGSNTNKVELYNGTSWSTLPSIATGRRSGAAGTQSGSSSTIYFGGRTTADQNLTEEFTPETSALGFSTITTS